MKKRVYIAGPITKGHLARNVNQATDAFVLLAKAGLAPFCPHWSVYSKKCAPGGLGISVDDDSVVCRGTKEGNESMSHSDWMGIDLPWVAVSDAILRLPGESTGADMEVQEAHKHGIPVFEHIEDLIEWSHKTGA